MKRAGLDGWLAATGSSLRPASLTLSGLISARLQHNKTFEHKSDQGTYLKLLLVLLSQHYPGLLEPAALPPVGRPSPMPEGHHSMVESRL